MATSLYRSHAGQEVSADVGEYVRWLSRYDAIPFFPMSPDGKSNGILISVLVPVFNTNPRFLRECIKSVLRQTYSNWEICLVDDCSTRQDTVDAISELATWDERIRIARNSTNSHISKTTNAALDFAKGEYVALLDHDDILHPEALAEVAAGLVRNPQWDMVYTDEDKIDAEGVRSDPYFKPDINPDLLRGQNCVSHLGVYRRTILREIGGFRSGLEGSQDWDVALRFLERVGTSNIGHIPRVLYHWRLTAESTSSGVSKKPYAETAALRAISEHLLRTESHSKVVAIHDQPGNFRVYAGFPQETAITVVVVVQAMSGALRRLAASIGETAGRCRDLEFIVVTGTAPTESALSELKELAGRHKVTVLNPTKPLNRSAANNYAASVAQGKVLLFMDANVEPIYEGWLQEMVSHALRPSIGGVGAKLYGLNGRIKSAGLLLGMEGVLSNAYRGINSASCGQMNRLKLTQNCTAVSAACFALRREVFLEVGGFDENLPGLCGDADICLRLRASGFLNVWSPFAELYHHDNGMAVQMISEAGGTEHEEQLLARRWQITEDRDPYYNRNLSVRLGLPTLAYPPRPAPEG